MSGLSQAARCIHYFSIVLKYCVNGAENFVVGEGLGKREKGKGINESLLQIGSC